MLKIKECTKNRSRALQLSKGKGKRKMKPEIAGKPRECGILKPSEKGVSGRREPPTVTYQMLLTRGGLATDY